MNVPYAKKLEPARVIFYDFRVSGDFIIFEKNVFKPQATRPITTARDSKGNQSPFVYFLRRVMAQIPPDSKGDFGLRKEVRLLVVDDHGEHFAQLQAAAEEYHADFSIECKLVSNAEEALEATSEWQPSVVLVDLHVIATTLDLLTQLAQIGPSVVATSESRIAAMSEKVARLGAVGYVTKADSTEDVESVLSYLASLASPAPVSH